LVKSSRANASGPAVIKDNLCYLKTHNKFFIDKVVLGCYYYKSSTISMY